MAENQAQVAKAAVAHYLQMAITAPHSALLAQAPRFYRPQAHLVPQTTAAQAQAAVAADTHLIQPPTPTITPDTAEMDKAVMSISTGQSTIKIINHPF